MKGGETFSTIDLFFVDDGAFPFPTRDAIVRGAPIIDKTLKKFDLLMRVGTTLEYGEEIKAKTECVFYPPPVCLDPIIISQELNPAITDALVVKQKRESTAAIAKRRKLANFESAETDRIHIPSVGCYMGDNSNKICNYCK